MAKKKAIPMKKNPVETFYKKHSSIIWIVVSLVVLFLVFWYVFQFWGTVTYKGLTFTAERYSDFNNLIVYHYSHYFSYDGQQVYKSNVYLRVDPRKNNVPVEGEITFPREKLAYLSASPKALQSCNDSQLALGEIGAFWGAHLVQIKVGTPDAQEALEMNLTELSCDTHPQDYVVMIAPGETTKIIQTENCTHIYAAQCEVIPAAEKYIVEALLDSKKSGRS